MKTKRCGKCDKQKNITNFYKDKTVKDGLCFSCIVCCKKYKKEYYLKNKETINSKNTINYYKNKKKRQKYCKKYNKMHKKEIAQQNKKWREKNKKYKALKDKIYQQKHKRAIRLYYKKYYKKNKKKLLSYNIKNRKMQRKNNLNIRLRDRLAKRIWDAIKNNYKSNFTVELLGCSIEFLKKHLEKQFKKGMNWKNYGKWHVDHIRPCASFDLSKPSQQRKCFNYTNLQPLWAKENLSKGAK
jgi:hypothetical protein